MTPKRIAPVWLMGLTNATFGMYGGMVAISLPEILAEQHIPETRIAAITAVAMSPAFWAFLICPMLDVRFTRRFYAIASAVFAALLMGFGLMNIHHLPLPLAAILLSLALLLPLAIYPFIPVTQPDGRLASESFSAFFRDILALLKRREVLIALALFLLPSGSFALTNIISGLSGDFHASARVIALSGGAGVTIAGVCGSLIFPLFSKRLALRPLYLAIGVVGACFTLSLLLLPRTPAVFAISLIGENVFQALAITGTFAIAFETIGQHNPLAATTFSVLGAACNFPIVYMEVVDGHAYSWHGVAGSFLADASLGLLACILLALMLKFVRRPSLPTTSAV
jgi:PAT family beta-lactamase induction signal transducer AmpG